MIYFLDVAEESGILNNIVRAFMGFLCKIIYPMIISAWDLFVALAKTQIFDSSLESGGIVSVLYTRVGLLLGILMLFRVIFSLIQMLINPEIFSDKEKGLFNIVKKAFIVILLLGFVPTIFSMAFRVQTTIIEDNTIGNIIFGKNVGSMENFGGALSANLFKLFYKVTPEVSDISLACPSYALTFMELQDYHTLNLIDECLTDTLPYNYEFGNGIQSGIKNVYVIDFHLGGFLAVAIGAAVLWMIIMYSIYLGARVVQLAVLQIIAPIPIISYLSPNKNDSLMKWAKICLSTFLDMFIRTAIIYFFALIVYLMFESENEGLNMIVNTSGASGTLLVFVQVAIILGALIIAKKLPDVIGEIFPSLGVGKGKLGFGLSWKKMTEGMLGYNAIKAVTGGAAGAATGSAIGFLGGRGAGRLTGIFGGALKGAQIGSKKGNIFKNIGEVAKQQSRRNAQKIEWSNAGSTFGGRLSQRLANTFGVAGQAEVFENTINEHKKEINKSKTKQNSYKHISEYKKNMEDRAESKLKTGSFAKGSTEWNLQQQLLLAEAKVKNLENSGASAHEIAIEKARYNAMLDNMKKQYIEESLKGNIKDGRITDLKKYIDNAIAANAEAFADGSFNGSTNPSTFEDIDNLEKIASGKSSDLEREIEMHEVAVANIENDPRYKRAVANRDAVGGHKGGK